MIPVSKAEVGCLIREFNVLLGEQTVPGKAVPGLDRGRFRSLLHNNFGMTDDMIMDGGNLAVFRSILCVCTHFTTVQDTVIFIQAAFLLGNLHCKKCP